MRQNLRPKKNENRVDKSRRFLSVASARANFFRELFRYYSVQVIMTGKTVGGAVNCHALQRVDSD
jgi:hypothetical protein